MVRPGPARRPNLEVVREGNPGKRAQSDLDGGVRLPSGAPDEPDWKQWWPAVRVPTANQLEKLHPLADIEGKPDLVKIESPATRDRLVRAHQRWLIRRDREVAERARKANTRAREIARRTWRRVVPQLDAIGVLADVDHLVLVELCTVVARIDECERDLSERGLWAYGERGAVKNPSATQVNQLRTAMHRYIGELGLSPVARDRLTAPEADDDGDSPWG